MNKNLKSKIIFLRLKGLTYSEIRNKLQCSKGVISYHCSNIPNNDDIKQKNIDKIDHSLKKEISSWDEKTKHLISILFSSFGVRCTEIADVLKINVDAIYKFTSDLKPFNYKNMSNYEKVKLRRKKIKLLSLITKGFKCENCGYDKCYEALEFHHIDESNKTFTIAKMCNHAWKTIKKEINKCSLLCSNCHRELHSNKKDINLKTMFKFKH